MRVVAWALFLFLFYSASLFGQEGVAPLRANPALGALPPALEGTLKTTSIPLPFFEDFTDYSLYPAPDRWADRQVYINNTMGVGVISRGVATFDALNERGRPYDTLNNAALRFADSLTSQAFNLAAFTPADSLYLSFFYQPQGFGFSPEATDSLMLFFRASNGQYRKQWSREGSTVQPFVQVMIPVRDTSFFYDGFRFRFVNKASINLNDDIWNLDYIRFAAGRSIHDTSVGDPATTTQPQPFLTDYTAMPYRQFIASPATEKAPNVTYVARANNSTVVNIPDGFRTVLQLSGATIGSGNGTLTIGALGETFRAFPNNVAQPPPGAPNARVVFENRFFFGDVGGSNRRMNDTILRETVFDNYLAYDDGTAERSYYLNLFATLPGKVAIEHRLNVADTLRGVSVLFGQQVPSASSKFFTAVVYRSLAGIDGATADDVVFQQEFLQPSFTDTVNAPQVYPFAVPVAMPAGKFYIGLIQPALSGSDSLYYALDVNRQGSNHMYFNVLNVWENSLVSGALMVRPLLGAALPQSIADVGAKSDESSFFLYPNPGHDAFRISGIKTGLASYRIMDAQGREVITGAARDGETIHVAPLSPGVYFVQLARGGGWSRPLRWVKL